MSKLETLEWWPDLVLLKDKLSLGQLAEKFEATPSAIAAALRRSGALRAPITPTTEDDLPPEPGDEPPAPVAPRSTRRVAASIPRATKREQAWQVVLRADGEDRVRIVVAPSVVDAADLVIQKVGAGQVVGLSFLGDILQ